MLDNLYWMKYSINISQKAPWSKLKTGVVLVSKQNELICSAYTGEEENSSWLDVLLKKIKGSSLFNGWCLYLTVNTLSKTESFDLIELLKLIHVRKIYVGLPDFRLENYLNGDPVLVLDYVHRYPDDLQREILKQNKRFYANSRQSIQYSSYYSANRISSFVLEKLERKGITISEEELNINKKSTALASLIFNKYEIEYEKAACIVDNILSEAFNNKYSKYDYLNDIRSFDLGWKQTFQSIYNRVSKKPMPGMNILNVGVGSGNEAISLFSNCPHITFVDIAGEGLERIKIQLPLSNFVVSKAENLSSLNENSYELYISLRTYNSSFFDINHAISEAYRVLKKDAIIIISIANGFLCSGEKRIIPGLIVPGTDFVDIYRGIDTVKLLHKNFVQIGFKNIQIFPTKTEIYLTAVK